MMRWRCCGYGSGCRAAMPCVTPAPFVTVCYHAKGPSGKQGGRLVVHFAQVDPGGKAEAACHGRNDPEEAARAHRLKKR